MVKAVSKEKIKGPILVVLPKFIGDAINTLSAIELLRKLYPKNDIYLLVRPFMVSIFARDQFYNVKIIPDDRFSDRKLSIFAMARYLKNYQFSMSVLFRGSLSEALLSKLARIKTVIGYAQNGRTPLLTHPLKLNTNHHYLLRYCRLINDTHDTFFEEFNIPKLTHQRTKNNHLEDGKTKIGLYFGGVNKGTRHYPYEQAKHVLTLLNDALSPSFTLIGDKTEQADNQRLFQFTKSINTTCEDLTGQTSLTELVDYIAAFDLLISIDSGPMHMAAAVNTPCVAIVGQGTSPWSLVVPKAANVLAVTAERSLKLNDELLVKDISAEHIVKLSQALIQPTTPFVDSIPWLLPEQFKK